jgi:hypothetical protein
LSDLISVDPDRCSQAAAQLDTLRDVLTANAPTIISILNMYWSSGVGHTESLGALTKARGQAPADAATMHTRAILAAAAANGSQAQAYSIDGMVTIPASPTVTAAAQAAAQALAQAEANGNKQAARASIQAIQQDIQSHLAEGQAGSAWLAAFYNAAAPQVAGLANVLHGQDGTGLSILSTQDKQILGTFAQGLAATANSGGLSQLALNAFTHAPDIWSSAMLLTLGPPGQAYGTDQGAQLLGGVTASLLDAERAGTLVVPANAQQLISQAKNLDGVAVDKALAQFDPTLSLLNLDTANGAAASYALSGPDGQAISQQLMTMQFVHYSFPDGNYGPAGFTAYSNYTGPQGPWDHYQVLWAPQSIANFLDAATAAPRGGTIQAQWAAQAALNIIDGTPSPTGSNGVNLPEQIRHALMDTYGRYMPDLAKSLADPGTSPVKMFDGTYMIGVGDQALSSFLQQICANKNDYATIQGMAGTAIGSSAALKISGGSLPGVGNPVDAFSQLYGDISKQAAAVGISQAEQQDLRNQILNTMIGMGETGFGMIPGGGTLTAAKDLLSFVTPVIPQFPTDLAAKAQAAAQDQLHTEQIMAMAPFIRGLEKAGVQLPDPPPPGSFDSSGAPTTAFFNWWASTGSGEVIHDVSTGQNNSLGDIPGGWVPEIQQMMGFGAGSGTGG